MAFTTGLFSQKFEDRFLMGFLLHLPHELYENGKINFKDYSDIEYNLNIYNALEIKRVRYRNQIKQILKDNESILNKYSINLDCFEKAANIIYKNKENPDGYSYCSNHYDGCDCKKHINKIIDAMPKEGIYNDYIDLINDIIKCKIEWIKLYEKIAYMLRKVDETD